MQYLLLCTNNPDAWHDPGPVTGDGVYDDWDTYTRAMADAGVLVSGAGLHTPEVATTVCVRDGERVLLDGPFMEAKEHIIGVYLIEVPDLDAALAWAAAIPNARTGKTEVRPVRPELTTEATLARA